MLKDRPRFLLPDVDWSTYRVLREAPGNRHVRMTYASRRLELMAPSRMHERLAYIVGRIINTWTAELTIDIQSCGRMTLSRDDLERALEPDNCYYVAHEPQVRAKDELDLTIDPPPDLAIEIGLSANSIDKLGLYAQFSVPEVWHYDGELFEALHLGADRTYMAAVASRCFPNLPLEQVAAVLGQVTTVPETKLLRSFRDWVRSHSQTSYRSLL